MLLVANGMYYSNFHVSCVCVGRGGRREDCRLGVEVVCVLVLLSIIPILFAPLQ